MRLSLRNLFSRSVGFQSPPSPNRENETFPLSDEKRQQLIQGLRSTLRPQEPKPGTFMAISEMAKGGCESNYQNMKNIYDRGGGHSIDRYVDKNGKLTKRAKWQKKLPTAAFWTVTGLFVAVITALIVFFCVLNACIAGMCVLCVAVYLSLYLMHRGKRNRHIQNAKVVISKLLEDEQYRRNHPQLSPSST